MTHRPFIKYMRLTIKTFITAYALTLCAMYMTVTLEMQLNSMYNFVQCMYGYENKNCTHQPWSRDHE